MSRLVIKTKKIIKNIKKVNKILKPKGIEWTLVTKILSGHKGILEGIIKDPVIKTLHSIGDSRLSNLKKIKDIKKDIVTLYLKPPSIRDIKKTVKYADITLNTSLETIKKLNEEAKRQRKTHKIIIMIELGELREGVLRENLVKFYKQCFRLKNIKILGIGANLGCMYGIEPTYDKMIQLSLYKQLLETKFDRKLKFISGGSSITLPLVGKKLPKNINHFRIGEAVFIGTSPLKGKKFKNLSTDVFSYKANIIELKKKKSKPDGKVSKASVGHTNKIKGKNKERYRAIVDFGILDVNSKELKPVNKNITFIGTTSDMSIYDLGDNIRKDNRLKKKVGHSLKFKPSYMAVARLIHSKYTNVKVK